MEFKAHNGSDKWMNADNQFITRINTKTGEVILSNGLIFSHYNEQYETIFHHKYLCQPHAIRISPELSIIEGHIIADLPVAIYYLSKCNIYNANNINYTHAKIIMCLYFKEKKQLFFLNKPIILYYDEKTGVRETLEVSNFKWKYRIC